MNLEFMCCILFGLTEIFTKPERLKSSLDLQHVDFTVTLIKKSISSFTDRSYINLSRYQLINLGKILIVLKAIRLSIKRFSMMI